jgi:hypothetical protein
MSDFTAKDITDLAFLYLVSLHILRCEFETAPVAVRYARQTNAHSNFKATDRNNTDLYQFLNILSDPHGSTASELGHEEANAVFWNGVHFNPNLAKQFLSNILAGNYDEARQRSILFSLETQLHITTPNYKSMRRIAVEWNSHEVTSDAQKLVITRMLQALRAKARRGDLLPTLEKLAAHGKYELFKVCDPETGDGCADDKVSTSASPNMGFLKALAIGALAGGVIGHKLGKR